MSREDVEMPVLPPRKRRQLEVSDARWLAVWASDEGLPEPDRRRAQRERERRKHLAPDVAVGVLEGKGGSTPEQCQELERQLRLLGATSVSHPFASKGLHQACVGVVDAVVVERRDGPERVVALSADVLIGLPSNPVMPTEKAGPLWAALRWAKDRERDVRIIWPNGSLTTGRWET